MSKSKSKPLLMALALFVVVLIGSLTAKAASQLVKTVFTSGPSGMTWPVQGSDGTWYIENGYNNASLPGSGYDHGCPKNCSQLFGFDLVLNLNSADTQNKEIISPVTGTVAFVDCNKDSNGNCQGYPGDMVSIKVDGTPDLRVSLVHVSNVQVVQGSTVTMGKSWIGNITPQSGNSHLHWNLYQLIDSSKADNGPNRKPVPFTNDTTSKQYGGYDTHIIGCQDFAPDGILSGSSYNGSVNQWASKTDPINCGLDVYGYWIGPTPTGSDQYPIHLYGSPASRNIQLGYQSSNINGKTVDYVDFWDYQNGKWSWIGRQHPNSNRQEFASFTLYEPGYIGTDVHTTDDNWHEAENGIRALCVIYPNGLKQCPNLTTVTYHDGSVHSPGVGGGGVVENQGTTASCSPGDDQVALFTDKDFGGQCVTKDAGVYNTPDEIGLPNDSISSIQFSSRSSVRVYVCRDANITNTCEWIDSDVSDLSTHSVGDNQISSLKVEHGKGITICNGENYSGSCTKLSDGVTNLAGIGADQCVKSVLYDSSYVGHYHVVLWSGGGKGAGNPVHLDQSTSPLNYCGATRIFAVEIYRKMPPNATQNSPTNGATLAPDTKELDLTYGGGDRFAVHVWNLTNHYDAWQGSLTSTTLHITGLTSGTYNWQVQGANDQGAGLWSDTWTFTIPVSSTPTPVPTQSPAPTPTSPPATLITMTVLLDGIGIAGDATNPNSAGNMNPLHPNRNAAVLVYNGSSLITTKYITISYVSGVFNGIVTVSGTVTGIAIATPGFLTSPVASITAGQNNHVTLRERNGDVNRDGFRSQADYDAIVTCYGSKVASCQYGYNADINDDGVVDGTDINLWLREA